MAEVVIQEDLGRQRNQMMTDRLFLGIDGGGSHCRASLFDGQGRCLGQGRGGPANPVYGLQQTHDSILQATRQALQQACLGDDCLGHLEAGAGLAGLHLPAMKRKMQQWQHPFASLHLTTDLHAAALGAHAGLDGGLIILGTGFSALAMVEGQLTQIGGYGFPINANGSGSWLGLEAVKAALLHHDKLGPATGLTDRLLTDCNATQLAEQLMHAQATDFARYAPLVFELAGFGDQVASLLVRQAADFVERVVQRLLYLGAAPVAITGGLSQPLKSWLSEDCQAHLCPAQAGPEQGAVMFARQQVQTQGSRG
ncbi:glucosamine kinase nucleotide-binding domain-containing protein [Bowmanella dokdonensis]|uniref:ATPase n=1 Tax=Bowmanella dokdonensis TaxID=751969 RepID=A0A939DNX2_9ALTE|nr:BadF/BadG/BcrA/BcrD ATPase family protein [Bowmanella dokdonensis]MBN7825261.1 ATPase [Bowmanella dokdonensis]